MKLSEISQELIIRLGEYKKEIPSILKKAGYKLFDDYVDEIHTSVIVYHEEKLFMYISKTHSAHERYAVISASDFLKSNKTD